jgi:hypothetical protein
LIVAYTLTRYGRLFNVLTVVKQAVAKAGASPSGILRYSSVSAPVAVPRPPRRFRGRSARGVNPRCKGKTKLCEVKKLLGRRKTSW